MLLTAVGGIAAFLLGIHRIADSLLELAGPSARRFMSSATRSPYHAMLTGAGVAAAIQSATATAITTLGLVGSGLISVAAGIALLLGAKFGATLVIQLAAFSLGDYAWAMIGVGYFASLWPRIKAPASLLLGAGLLFLGLDITVASMSGLADSEIFSLLIEAASARPLAVLLIGFALGGMLSSANATSAIALGLYLANAVPLTTAIALIAGGNAGSTIMPLLVSRTFDSNAQRTALMQTLVLTASGLFIVILIDPAVAVVDAIGGGQAREVANAYTLLNLFAAIVGTVFAPLLAKLSARLVPTSEDDAAPKYLRHDTHGDSQMARAFALRETVRISDQVGVMMELAVDNLGSGHWNPEPIRAREMKVDRLTYDVVDYLARHRSEHGEDPVTEQIVLIATELEHMGDQIRRLFRREEKLRTEGLEFSREGRAELKETAERVASRMREAFTAFATDDVVMAERVLEGRHDLEEFVAKMRVAHLGRLEERLPASRASSSHHLEVLTLLRDVDASANRVAGGLIDIHAAGQTMLVDQEPEPGPPTAP